jgi:hypothetical protein
MQTPSAMKLLSAWENSLQQPPHERALTLLRTALIGEPIEELEQWSLGKRDAHLLEFRELVFGSQFCCVTACPSCATRLEMNFMAADIKAPFAGHDPLIVRMTTADGDYAVQLRPPNSRDLREIIAHPSRELLLRQCIVEIHRDGDVISPDELRPDVIAQTIDRLERADPQANVQLEVRCAECHAAWTAHFDILSFLWTEIQAWAERTLREVHQLAAAYGWNEATILGMPARRRQRYLSLVSP